LKKWKKQVRRKN